MTLAGLIAPRNRAGLMFEEVHFPEQVHFLLAGQERVVVDALQERGDARGGLDSSDVPAPEVADAGLRIIEYVAGSSKLGCGTK